MDDLNNIKAIWLSADTGQLPAAEEIRIVAGKFRNNKLFKTAGLVLVALVLTLAEAWVAFAYHATMITTRIAGTCIILAGLILIVTNLNTLSRFYRNKDISNKDFISFLQKTRQRQLFYYQKTQVAGLILSFIGLLLYPYEIVYGNIIAFIIVYTLSSVFLLIMWLVVRKHNFRKQNLKMSELIGKMEKLSTQL